MILVKIESYRGAAFLEGGMLSEEHIVANTIGGALNSFASGPGKGAVFVVTVLDTDVSDPVYDKS